MVNDYINVYINFIKFLYFLVEKEYLIRTIVACLPAWFRFAQCLRRYRDDTSASHGIFPHLVNAGKYSTTFFVVIFSTLTQYTDSKCI